MGVIPCCASLPGDDDDHPPTDDCDCDGNDVCAKEMGDEEVDELLLLLLLLLPLEPADF